MESIFIFGTGSGAVKYLEEKKEQYDVLGFIDSNEEKQGSLFKGLPVISPEGIKDNKYDYIVLANEYVETLDRLIELEVKLTKIKIIYPSCLFNRLGRITQQHTEMYEGEGQGPLPVCTMKMSYVHPQSCETEYSNENDYVRYKLLELLTQEVVSNHVKGNVAEVGVFSGSFARIINRLFPDRTLYLFDTFEGFDARDREHDIENNYSESAFFESCNNFKDTNVELVLRKMIHRDNCVIKKGYFPETASDLEDVFSLVSLDVDLYLPMYSALEYFYPRLSQGGYLMLHDYNHKEFEGVKQAVRDYEAKFGKMTKVPIPDQGGTLVIAK